MALVGLDRRLWGDRVHGLVQQKSAFLTLPKASVTAPFFRLVKLFHLSNRLMVIAGTTGDLFSGINPNKPVALLPPAAGFVVTSASCPTASCGGYPGGKQSGSLEVDDDPSFH